MTFGRRQLWLSLISFALVFGFALHLPLQVSAQDVTGSEDSLNFDELDGFQRGVSRTYLGDISALFGGLEGGSPEASPDLSSLGLFSLVGIASQFENDDQAKDGFDKVAQSAKDDAASGEDPLNLEDVEVEKIGDQTKAFKATVDQEGVTGSVSIVLVQKGNMIFAGLGISFGDDPTEQIHGFVKAIADGTPGDGDGTFAEDGTSTGGLWDLFPAAGDEVLQGTTPAVDEQLTPGDGN